MGDSDIIYVKDLGPSSTSRQVYKSTHDKRPDLIQGISWSPDGKQIAFAMTPWSDIYLLTLGAKDAVNLTKTDNVLELTPAISPNGKLIAFVSDRRSPGGGSMDIYTMRLDGKGTKLLLECQGKCYRPEWSPDGKQLVFQMGKDLYLLPASGGKPTRLVSGAINENPAWSPDGQWIAFTRSQAYDSQPYIYLVKPDGTGIHTLTGENLRPRQLSWSPDGGYIAFEDVPRIKAIHVQSGQVFDLLGSMNYAPSWKPEDPVKRPTPTATTITAQMDCSNGWSHLKADGKAQVAGNPGDPPNRVRSGPSRSAAQTGLLKPGTVVTLLEGPVCADGLVLWKVSEASLPGGMGWTAEGDGKEYWLKPYQ